MNEHPGRLKHLIMFIVVVLIIALLIWLNTREALAPEMPEAETAGETVVPPEPVASEEAQENPFDAGYTNPFE